MLAGKVIDSHTGRPVAGVALSFRSSGVVHRSTSNEQGYFGLADISEGCWRVQAWKPPYSEYCKRCSLTGDYISICLQIEALSDEAVTA